MTLPTRTCQARLILGLASPLALFAATPAHAQLSVPPAPVDLSGVNASIAAVQAQIPTVASTVPPMEAVGGATGTAGTYRPGNAVQPRITRSVSFTTGAGGTAAITWADMGAVPLVFPVANVAAGSTAYPKCSPVIGTITSTGATIKCTTPLVTVAVIGVGIAPVDTAAVGVTGQVLAIPVS